MLRAIARVMKIKVTAAKADTLESMGFQVYVEFAPTEEQLDEVAAEDPSMTDTVAAAKLGDEDALNRCALVILAALD